MDTFVYDPEEEAGHDVVSAHGQRLSSSPRTNPSTNPRQRSPWFVCVHTPWSACQHGYDAWMDEHQDDAYPLLIARVKLRPQSEHWSTLKNIAFPYTVDIGERLELPSGHVSVLVHTHWIRVLQRLWRNKHLRM